MKITKSYKFIALLGALLLSLIIAFACLGLNVVSAEEEPAHTFAITSTIVKVDEENKTVTFAKGIQYKENALTVKFDDESVDFNDYKFLVGDEDVSEKGNGYFMFRETTDDGVISFKRSFKSGDDYTNEDYKLVVKEDVEAPEYIEKSGNEALFEEFENDLKKACLSDIEKGIYIKAGDSLTIPSMEELINDDIDLYENLTYKVYYQVNTTDSSNSGNVKDKIKIPNIQVGKYKFHVVFIDKNDNETEMDDWSDYTFEFNIIENYPIEVTPVSNDLISKGYVNSLYKAGTSTFKVTSGAKTPTYALTYSSTENGTFKELSEEDAKAVNFSTSNLSFTPNKIGYYKITGTAKSETGLETSGEVVIKVDSEMTEVPTPSAFSTWMNEHLLAVIFLCIAFVCLVAIIVLLCIKPKDKTEVVETTSVDMKK